jgi:hypothetical protein
MTGLTVRLVVCRRAELVVDLSALFTQDDQKDRPQGRSEREAESYNASYGEALSDARTERAVFFSILL